MSKDGRRTGKGKSKKRRETHKGEGKRGDKR
jgi:hypothetical protein